MVWGHRAGRNFLRWSALACVAASAWASEYHGQVLFSGVPLPGALVTATQGDKKVVAVSDEQGIFAFPELADGPWKLSIEMTGFAPLKQDIEVAPKAPVGAFELKVLSLDQIRAELNPVPSNPPLSTGAAGPPLAGSSSATASASASNSATQAAPGVAPDVPVQDATVAQANDGLLINGSVNNAATSQYSLNPAFGNTRNSRSLYNGNLFFRLDNSALDALPYPVTGVPVTQQFNNFTLGLNFGAPIKLPHLMPRGPFFQLNYQRTQNSAVAAQAVIVPTGQDAAGNWNLGSATVSQVYAPSDLAAVAPGCNSYLVGTGITQQQIDAGAAVFANNTIPAACVSHQATTLLALYPQPNLVGNPLGYNYQLPLDTSTHSDQLVLNLNKQVSRKDNLNGAFTFAGSRSSNPNIFGFLDKSNVLGLGTVVNWNRRFTQRMNGTLTYSFSRQRSQLLPHFANRNNIEGEAGIAGASAAPEFWGPPSLSFASGIAGLNDGVSAYNRNETNGFTTNFYWNKFRHNVKFGGDFKRLEFNYYTQSNPRGALGFTGAGTRSSAIAGSGSDFGDFLLGVPDTSSIAYGNPDKYLRQSLYDAYVTDDFRVTPELTLNVGVRWEYGAPMTEVKGRLVNLDIAPGFTAETPVVASRPAGAVTGQHYPTSLVEPDYSRPEPNIGIAWRPLPGSSLLIRSGYQISNDTSVYRSSAYAMAQQFPLSTSASIQNSPVCAFNMANPFLAPACSKTSPDTFALDPHFKVGYVQIWNLIVQRDLPFSMQMVASYNGIKGTHGVQEFLPNTCPPSLTGQLASCTAAPSGYRYRTSNGNLTREAGILELRRRLRNGLTAQLVYTFSKSLDDVYSLSGQGSATSEGTIAQDWTHPEAERALSSNDQRHLLVASAQYTTGMGLGGKALMGGWRGALYKEWTVATRINAGSGLPETVVCGLCTATGSGLGGTVRVNTLASPYGGVVPGFHLNAASFAAPVGAWGSSRRNSIEGPARFSMNASMSRTFRLRDRYSLDGALNATNVLNHVVFTGWNSTWSPLNRSFGAPTSANGMRAISLEFRLRF
jgi:hypothetical protein